VVSIRVGCLLAVATIGCDRETAILESVGLRSISRNDRDASIDSGLIDGGPFVIIDSGTDAGSQCNGKVVFEKGDGGKSICLNQLFVKPPGDAGFLQGFGSSVTLNGAFTFGSNTREFGNENFISGPFGRLKMQSFVPPVEERTKFSGDSSTLCGAVRINNQSIEAALVFLDGGSVQLQPGFFSECTAFYKGIALVNSNARGYLFWKNGVLSSQLPLFPGSTLVGQTTYVGFCGENGEVCGVASPSPFVPMSNTPFMMVDGGFVPIRHTGPVTHVAGVHPSGRLVGNSLIRGVPRAIEWKTNGSERILPSTEFVPNVYAYAIAVNKYGEIAGEFFDENRNHTAVLWIENSLFLLNDAAPNTDTVWELPFGISDDGFITGAETFEENGEARSRPFLIHFEKMP
jgi:hypothetical protein